MWKKSGCKKIKNSHISDIIYFFKRRVFRWQPVVSLLSSGICTGIRGFLPPWQNFMFHLSVYKTARKAL
jgi:hypothetical protein